MADLLKEVFYFQIIKPNNSFSIMSDGKLKFKKTISGKKQENKKKISLVKLNSFFSEFEKLLVKNKLIHFFKREIVHYMVSVIVKHTQVV